METNQMTHRGERDHEPTSYWQETALHYTFSDALPANCEVAVVGGGIVGAALSYCLARAGIRVVILERSAPAREATGRNGGLVSVSLAESYLAAVSRLGRAQAHSVLELAHDNQVLLRRIVSDEAIECDYREPGSINMILNEEQWHEAEQAVGVLLEDGLAAHLLDRAELGEYIQTPPGPEILGGKFVPENGVVHPVRLVQGLLQAASQYGARGCIATVEQVLARDNGVHIQTKQGLLSAETVIVAVNAWSGELLSELKTCITPVRGQMLAYAPVSPVFKTGVSVSLTPTGEYWQQRADGTILLGGCRAAAPDQDVGMRPNQPTAEVQAALEQVLPRLFPQLQGLAVVKRWAGMMAFTPDYLPIVDQAPVMPQVLVAGGFCGHGMAFALRIGQLLTEAVTAHTWPPALLPLRLRRETLVTP